MLGQYFLWLIGMFGWVDFRKDRKKNKIKMGEKTFLVGVWLEGGEEKKIGEV